jgi:hypothetical protein
VQVFDPLSAAAVIGVIALFEHGRRRVAEHQATRRRSVALLQAQRNEQLRYQQARLELHGQITDAVHAVGRDVFGNQG